MEKIKVGVVGATGYAGAEICRLIYLHPAAELAAISSVSFEGMALSDVYPAYRGLCDLVCGTQAEVVEKSDVIFAALPHGLSQDLAAECDAQGKAFIDLGADFRLESEEEYKEWYGGTFADKALHEKAVYGLPELFREQIKKDEARGEPGLLHDGGAAGARSGARAGIHRAGRHHRELRERRDRRGPQVGAEQPLSGAERGHVGLQGREPPPHAGD